MKLTPLPLLAAALFLTAAKAPEARRIDYRVTPVAAADGSAVLRVDMRFRGDLDGETKLLLPSEWAGSGELWRHSIGLEIRGARSLGGFYDAPLIRHRPGARLHVRYTVATAYSKPPGMEFEKARPLILDNGFFFHGEGVFSLPEGREAAPARFRWGKAPKGWRIASDLDHLRRQKSTVANMINSVAIGGRDLAVVERRVGNAPLRIASLGRWSFSTEELADAVQPVIAASDAFWREESSPFLVVLAPLGEVPAGSTVHGTGRTDAFSIAATSRFELRTARRFLGHEYMHSWIPIMLGAMPEQDEAVDYWFSEGFTDWLAAKVLLRSGLWSFADYAADKNQTLLRYGTSPVKSATAADVAANFWTDSNLQQLSYDRGHIYAAMVDAQIIARTEGKVSLDDVLRSQRKAATGNSALATDLFRAKVLELAGLDVAEDVERYHRRGQPLALPADLFGGCASLVTERRKAFDRGFDAQATRLADGEIAGVDPSGPAYAAGMRDGMIMVSREAGATGDSSVEMVYRILEETGLKTIRYFPAGKTEHEVQKMVVTAQGPEAEAACRKSFGGAAE